MRWLNKYQLNVKKHAVCDTVATFNLLISNYFQSNSMCGVCVYFLLPLGHGALFSFTRMNANACDVARKHISMFNLP